MVNICPVCGYQMAWPPIDFHVCPSCGTEFGYDDAGRSHVDLRSRWLEEGARWWSTNAPPPANWDPYVQLDNLVEPFAAAFRTTRPNQAPHTGFSKLIASGLQTAITAGLGEPAGSQHAA